MNIYNCTECGKFAGSVVKNGNEVAHLCMECANDEIAELDTKITRLRSQRTALREALKDLVDYCDLQLRTVYDGAVDEIRERLQSVLDATKEPV